MNPKDLFWEDISLKLNETYNLKSHPATWKKGEIEIFLEHFKKRVTDFRTLKNITPASDVKISYDTFRRILIKNETKGSDYTRDIFAQYFGEKSYSDYINKFEKPELSKKATSAQIIKHKISILLVSGLAVLLLSSLFYHLLNKENSVCFEINQLIEKAIAAEINAYKSVPNSDESVEKLKKYFFEDQVAYKKILQVINNEKKRKWILNNDSNISSAVLIDFDCKYIDNDLATVTTKEHWNIQWYDTQLNEYAFIYDTINTQIYYLKKRENKWKISINDYDKQKVEIFVKLFNDDEFNESLSLDEVKKKVLIFMSNGDTQSALWWFQKYSEEHSLSITDDLILLKGKLNSSIRRVNTHGTTISKHHTLIKEIDIEILNLIKLN